MNFLVTLEISASGLYVQRKRMDIISSNLANIETVDASGPNYGLQGPVSRS